jgi:hypothetical protein
MIVILIIPFIMGAVAVAMITSLKVTTSNDPSGAVERLAESHDAQITSALFVRDVQSSVALSTLSTPACGPTMGSPAPKQVLELAWNRATSGASAGQYQDVVAYVQTTLGGNAALVRYFCGNLSSTTPTSTVVVSHKLGSGASPITLTLTCSQYDPDTGCTTDAGSSTSAPISSLDVTLVEADVTEQSGFPYVLKASPRQVLGSTNSLVGSAPPLLLLGTYGAQCGPGNEGLSVNGIVAINSGAKNSIDVGNQGLTAQQVYSQNNYPGTPNPGAPVNNFNGTPSYATGPALNDPLSQLPAPSPSAPNTYPYGPHTPLTQGNDPADPTHTKLLSGTYILQDGIAPSVDLVSESGGVFFYVESGPITLQGGPNTNLWAMTAGPYAGVLLYMVPQPGMSSGSPILHLQGNPSFTSYNGVVDITDGYAQLGGNATITVLGLIASGLSCNGTTSGSFGPTITTTTVASSQNPSTSGATVSFTASVTSVAGAPPGGTVTFNIADKNSAVVNCSGGSNTKSLVGGTATCVSATPLTDSLSPYTVTATYSGTLGFEGSPGSLSPPQAVRAITTTALSSSPSPGGTNTSYSGQAVNLVATVSGGSGTPGGTVTFSVTENGGTVDTCQGGNMITMAGGTATCNIVAGTWHVASSPIQVKATYNGDATHAPSPQASLTQAVVKSPTGTVLISNHPAGQTSGSSVKFTATVTPSGGGSGTPSGTVIFTITPHGGGASVVCNGGSNSKTLSGSGVASCTVSSLLVKAGSPYSVVGVYQGDPNFQGSTSNTVLQTMN